MLTMCNRLSSEPVIKGVVGSGYDKPMAKLHKSPTIYTRFTSVSFMKVAPVSLQDSPRYETDASVYHK